MNSLDKTPKSNSQENPDREKKHIQTLMAMKVDGIIISISENTVATDIFELVTRRGMPIVFIDRVPKLENVNTVTVDDRGGAFKATELAIKMGYRKIGHFAGYSSINIGRQRLLGFQDAMNKYGIEINPDWVIEGTFGESHGYNSLLKLYGQKNLPEFIFTATYPIAFGIYRAAREINLKIPNELDLICFGNAKAHNFLSPPLSCIDQPTSLIGRDAMNILLDNIENSDEYVPKRSIIETNIILRGTCIQKRN